MNEQRGGYGNFLGAELEGKAHIYWFELQKEIQPLLDRLENVSYGEELTSIGVISTILKKETWERGWEKEKKYYSKKRKEADIRLRIDYNKFVRAKKEERRKIYIEHILESVRVAGEKAKGNFNVEGLITDIKNILYEENPVQKE